MFFENKTISRENKFFCFGGSIKCFLRMEAHVWLFFLIMFLVSTVSHSMDDFPWLMVSIDHGITVLSRDRPDRAFPAFRAHGQIRGRLFHVMAVILDNKRSPEWIPNCIESRQIKRLDSRRTIVYSVTNFPWPISNRDTVVESFRDTIKLGSEYKIWIRAKPDLLPLVEGFVRIPYSQI